MREVALDTETTGLEAEGGDRIFEIGCIELQNRVATGAVFYALLDPERPLSQASIDITGFKDADLVGKPKFSDVVADFRAFIADDPLVIHNASFDVRFINAEFKRLGVGPLNPSRVVDTLAMARKRFPGAQNSLDALCRRFSIDNSHREKHGALLDTELLAEVYLELTGGRQPGFSLDTSVAAHTETETMETSVSMQPAIRRPSRRLLTDAEEEAHRAFVEGLAEEPSWSQHPVFHGKTE